MCRSRVFSCNLPKTGHAQSVHLNKLQTVFEVQEGESLFSFNSRNHEQNVPLCLLQGDANPTKVQIASKLHKLLRIISDFYAIHIFRHQKASTCKTFNFDVRCRSSSLWRNIEINSQKNSTLAARFLGFGPLFFGPCISLSRSL